MTIDSNSRIRKPYSWIFFCIILLTALFSPAAYSTAKSPGQVHTGQLSLSFNRQGAFPIIWKACSPDCRSTVAQKKVRFDSENSSSQQLELVIKDHPVLTDKLNSIPYRLERKEDHKFVHMEFVSDQFEPGVALRKYYRISKDGYEIYFSFRFVGERAEKFIRQKEIGIRLFTGKDLVPTMLSGFSSGFEKANAVMVTVDGATEVPYEEEEEEEAETERKLTNASLEPESWSGIRSRFWALLLQNQNSEAEFTADFSSKGLPQVTLYSPL